MAKGLIIAAPASGSGKTTLTLGLLRALRRRGLATASAKVGPDYIDPRFHQAAGSGACRNLDLWAMRGATLDRVIGSIAAESDLVIAEGVMGLFDGAGAEGASGTGSTADLAKRTGWPVILVVDVRGQAQSAAALVHGFNTFDPAVKVAGVIFNRTGGPGHAQSLRNAVAAVGVPVLGALPRDVALELPSRHLGLVQAGERHDLDRFIETAADRVEAHVEVDAVMRIAADGHPVGSCDGGAPALPPPGRRIALASDTAFAFAYPHLLESWRSSGARIVPFSPLADEAPPADCDAVYLPGGYPELHAAHLADCGHFLAGLRAAAGHAFVYGECGGFMVLGTSLTDGDGRRWPMAGLLPVSTSFERPRLTLGYRVARLLADSPFGPKGTAFRGHEFHYAAVVDAGPAPALFEGNDAIGTVVAPMGLRRGTVAGSFLHLVDLA